MSQFQEVRQDSIAFSLFVCRLAEFVKYRSKSKEQSDDETSRLVSVRHCICKCKYLLIQVDYPAVTQVVLQICLTVWDWLLLLSILFDF